MYNWVHWKTKTTEETDDEAEETSRSQQVWTTHIHIYNFHALFFFSNESELILDFSGFIDWSSIVSDILATPFYLFTLGCGFVSLVGWLPTFRSEGRIFFILDSAPFCLSSAYTFCFEDDNAFSTSLPLRSVNHAVCDGDINDDGQVRRIFFCARRAPLQPFGVPSRRCVYRWNSILLHYFY